jgi:hypothetical protein
MSNWCICWFFTHFLLGILIYKGLTGRRLYKSFGVKGLNIAPLFHTRHAGVTKLLNKGEGGICEQVELLKKKYLAFS